MEVAGEVLINPPLLTEQTLSDFIESGIGHSAATARHSRKRLNWPRKDQVDKPGKPAWKRAWDPTKRPTAKANSPHQTMEGTRWLIANWESRPWVGRLGTRMGTGGRTGVPSQGPGSRLAQQFSVRACVHAQPPQ